MGTSVLVDAACISSGGTIVDEITGDLLVFPKLIIRRLTIGSST